MVDYQSDGYRKTAACRRPPIMCEPTVPEISVDRRPGPSSIAGCGAIICVPPKPVGGDRMGEPNLNPARRRWTASAERHVVLCA